MKEKDIWVYRNIDVFGFCCLYHYAFFVHKSHIVGSTFGENFNIVDFFPHGN